MNAPIAIIDPHVHWYDADAVLHEVRIYTPELNVAGVSILGRTPLPTLGHSRFCSVAMTTGGPDHDLLDIFEEENEPLSKSPINTGTIGQWPQPHRAKDNDQKRQELARRSSPSEVAISSSHHGSHRR